MEGIALPTTSDQIGDNNGSKLREYFVIFLSARCKINTMKMTSYIVVNTSKYMNNYSQFSTVNIFVCFILYVHLLLFSPFTICFHKKQKSTHT